MATLSRSHGTFTRVEVIGRVDVRLHTDAHEASFQFQGQPLDLTDVRWTLKEGVLRVIRDKRLTHTGTVVMDVNIPHLMSFAYHGKGAVVGQNIRTHDLHLDIENQGSTEFSGQLGLRSLTLSGSGTSHFHGLSSRGLRLRLAGNAHLALRGKVSLVSVLMRDHSWLSLYWVDSRHLVVRAKDQSFVQLAGITDWMDVRLRGNARFNGRYLRATRAFVKTFDTSRADMVATRRQHTLASGASNIYVYDRSVMATNFMAFSGSVLDLRGWDRPYYQEPVRD